QVADSGLDAHTAVRLDNEDPIEAGRATDVATQRHAHATHLRADPFRGARHPLAPFELLRPAIEGFLEERARRIRPLAFHLRSEWRLALRAIDSARGHLIEPKLARSFRDHRFHDHDTLQAAR